MNLRDDIAEIVHARCRELGRFDSWRGDIDLEHRMDDRVAADRILEKIAEHLTAGEPEES